MKKFYSINHTKKVVTVDDKRQMSWKDKIDLDFYAKAGYVIKHRNARKHRLVREKADYMNKRDILKVLKCDSLATKEFEKIMKERGFFSARKYYYEWVKAHNIGITYVTTSLESVNVNNEI